MEPADVARAVTDALFTAARTAHPEPAARPVREAMDALREALVRLIDVDPDGVVDAPAGWLGSRLRELPVPALHELMARARVVLDAASATSSPATRVVAFHARSATSRSDNPADWLTPRGRGDAPAVESTSARHAPTAGAADGRSALPLAHRSPDQLDQIVQIEQQIVAGIQQRLGDEHPDTVAARLSLADVYRWTGRVDEAVRTLRRVLADQERLLGPDHPDTLAVRRKLRQWTDG